MRPGCTHITITSTVVLPDAAPAFVGVVAGGHIAMSITSFVVFGVFSKMINKGFPAPSTPKKD